jgi:hypothetical protein
MRRQTSRNFVWLVYFDRETKPTHRQQIQEVLGSSSPTGSQFIPRYVINQEHMTQDIKDLFSSAAYHREWLLTTRLDSDDAFHPSAIDRIQQEFLSVVHGPQSPNRFAINLRDGFQFVIDGDNPTHAKQLFTMKHVSNMFISLAERPVMDDVRTVLFCQHDDYYYRLRDHLPLFQVTDLRAWAMAIHGANIVTGASSGWPSLDNRTLAAFGPFFESTQLSKKAYLRNSKHKFTDLAVRAIRKLGRLAGRKI